MPRLAVLALVALASASPAAAGPGKVTSGGRGFVATEAAAAECFAQGILANPGATAKARSGLWYEAASVIGFICRPEVNAMMVAHDRKDGPSAGMRHFRTVFVRNLGRMLADRLVPELTQAMASAEPRAETGD